MSEVKRNQFMFNVKNCKLMFNNSEFPCECRPWMEWMYGGNPHTSEPDCSTCEVAKKYGEVPEENGEADGE